jgi:hypothetical protein
MREREVLVMFEGEVVWCTINSHAHNSVVVFVYEKNKKQFNDLLGSRLSERERITHLWSYGKAPWAGFAGNDFHGP